MKRRLVAVLACRMQGTRLYGKPVQNLDVKSRISIIDNIIDCLQKIDCIDEIVLGISEGMENDIFKTIAREKNLRYAVGDQIDVLSRLINCGELFDATDVFRVTSECPFIYYEAVSSAWNYHNENQSDATFLDNIIDGCGFEIITMGALKESYDNGDETHRSEFCTLYIRENEKLFKISRLKPPKALVRYDLRLTVDNPEDLALCRAVYTNFKSYAPNIPVYKIVQFLDANPELIKLTSPYLESGYSIMYK